MVFRIPITTRASAPVVIVVRKTTRFDSSKKLSAIAGPLVDSMTCGNTYKNRTTRIQTNKRIEFRTVVIAATKKFPGNFCRLTNLTEINKWKFFDIIPIGIKFIVDKIHNYCSY